MKIGNLKSVKPKVFKFEKGQNWDGDEAIIHHIESLLLDENVQVVKQKTYITIQCAKEVKKSQSKESKK